MSADRMTHGQAYESDLDALMDAGASIYAWWCAVDVSTAYDAALITATHPDYEPEDDAPTIQRVVTGADIRKATAHLLRTLPESTAARDIRRRQIDAASADAILQVAVYGKVVYG